MTNRPHSALVTCGDQAATAMRRVYLFPLLVTMLCAAQCASAGEPPKHSPGDIVAKICPSNGAPCYWGPPAGDPGVPTYGNLISGRYANGEFMCDDGAHPVQGPRDLQEMQRGDGRPGFHCEADPPPPPPFPWKAIGFSCAGIALLLVGIVAPRLWRMLKPVLRLGGWRVP